MGHGYNPDFSDDYLMYDFAEGVTLQSRNGTVYTEIPVGHATRGQPSQKERAPTNGVYTGFDLQWLLPGKEVGLTPKPGDKIFEPDGTAWTILTRSYDQMDQVYDCYCVNLILANDLTDTITFYKPDLTASFQDSAGSYKPSFTAAHSNVTCKIQEQAGEYTEERGRRGTLKRYTVFLAEEITNFAADWYGEDSAGNKYDIVNWQNAERIDELMTVTVERRP